MDTTLPNDIEDLTGEYTIDPKHTRLGFIARHAMVTKVRGQFDEFQGTIHLDAADPTKSRAELVIEVASVATGQPKRDEHLRTNDFFDVATHPQIRFESTGAEIVGDDEYRLTGDLTIKGVTKPISIDFTFTGSAKDHRGRYRAGFEGSTVIKRSEWDVTYNSVLDSGGLLVAEKIVLEFDVSAIKEMPDA